MTDDDPLALDPEAMRAMGHRMVDFLVDELTAGGPALRRATPEEMAARIGGPPPEEGRPLDEVLAELHRDVLPFRGRAEHPRFFAFIPACPTWPGALGDFLASALNVYGGSWMEGAGPSRLELVVLDWFKEWIGYPAEAGGLLVSGGSAANMTALACARESLVGPMTGDVVAYVSDQSHSSIARGARALGFRPDQVRVLPARADRRLPAEVVAGAIAADRAAGRRPLLVCASAGATNTGAIDPLDEIAEVCAEHGVWLHVDAAYGGFAAVTERGRRWLAGIERADSVTLDPHKWLYQPFECGALLVRRGALLRRAFEMVPDYLKDAVGADGEVNFSDLGFQLTRQVRAFKVWLSLQTLGLGAFRAAVDRSLDIAAAAEGLVRDHPELELMAPATLGIVCFRRRVDGDEDEAARVNAALVAALDATGEGLVSSTRLRGRYAIRLCVLNHTTGLDDVRWVLDWFAAAPAPTSAPAPAVAPDRRHLAPPGMPSGPLADVPLLAGLDPDTAQTVLAAAQERRVAPGEDIVRRYDAERDFFVVLEGTAEVVVDGDRAGELRRGDFFGEL
ncbi:MAG TPA: aminotransferase class I/II-fold pyridoxal phosphate-dependent enzyme, partial [Solirubrobacteraceae bacterium]